MLNVDHPYKITIFTPTYNRGEVVGKLYESLKKQTVQEFEWLVVDDGSTDNTGKLFSEWAKDCMDFPITYYRKENGGKHRAINTGLNLARGNLFFIVDSDDCLISNAVENVLKWEGSLNGQTESFVGVAGLLGYEPSRHVGKTFKGEYLDVSALDRTKYNILGDKAEVFYTEVLKKFKFPEIEGEKFITESVVWNRLAHAAYKMRWFNEIIYLCDYRADGMTRNIDKLHINNMKGYTLYIQEYLKYKTTNKGLLKLLSAYIYRGRLSGRTVRRMAADLEMSHLFVYSLLKIGILYKKLKG